MSSDFLAQERMDLEQEVAAFEAITVRLGWLSRRRLAQELDNFSLTVPQYMALTIIQDRAGCSMSELAEASHQVSATMTGIIDRLEERGLVARERDPADRRALRMALTSAGEQLLQRISARKRAWLAQFLGQLEPGERRAMINVAQRYLEVVEQSTLHEVEG